MKTTEKGKLGENTAADFLTKAGFKILARNFRTRRGELDIVASDGDVLVFVEVKHWDRFSEDDLGNSVDGRKVARLLHAARGYMAGHPEYEGKRARFDLVFVPKDGKEILHLKDVIEEES